MYDAIYITLVAYRYGLCSYCQHKDVFEVTVKKLDMQHLL